MFSGCENKEINECHDVKEIAELWIKYACELLTNKECPHYFVSAMNILASLLCIMGEKKEIKTRNHAHVFKRIAKLSPWLITARSGFKSLLKSPTPAKTGPGPAVTIIRF